MLKKPRKRRKKKKRSICFNLKFSSKTFRDRREVMRHLIGLAFWITIKGFSNPEKIN